MKTHRLIALALALLVTASWTMTAAPLGAQKVAAVLNSSIWGSTEFYLLFDYDVVGRLIRVEKARGSPRPLDGNASQDQSTADGSADLEIATTMRVPKRNRVPDGLNPDAKELSEIKNVAKQSLTAQLRDFLKIAESKGYKMVLYTRSDTKLTKPLQELVDAGKIIVRNIPE